MKKIKNIVISLGLALASLGVMAVPQTAEAINIYQACDGSSSSQVCASTSDSASSLIKRISNVLMFIVGAVAVIMIIISGIRYASSGGNSAQVTAAKNTLLYSVVGLIVALLAYAVVGFVIANL